MNVYVIITVGTENGTPGVEREWIVRAKLSTHAVDKATDWHRRTYHARGIYLVGLSQIPNVGQDEGEVMPTPIPATAPPERGDLLHVDLTWGDYLVGCALRVWPTVRNRITEASHLVGQALKH